MLETTIPWWRRALTFALSGFRSGFGVFQRRAREESNTEAKFSVTLRETLEEESALIDPIPQAEILAVVAPPLPAEPAREDEAALADAPIAEVESIAENAETFRVSDEIDGIRSSGAEAPIDTADDPRGLKPPPPSASEFSAAFEAPPEAEVEDILPAASVLEPADQTEPVFEVKPEPAEAEIFEEAEPVAKAEPKIAETAEVEAMTESALEPVEKINPAVETESIVESAPLAVAAPSTPAERAAPPLELTAQPTAEEAIQQKADERTAARLAAQQKKRDESAEQSPFSVLVGRVYDGPLDLLLDLIRKQDIDIYDIPIAKITSQFLAYVNQLKSSDIDVAGEFIYTASLLIHIKSKMLLPRAATGPDDAAEDPRRELVERLLEHERFKNAAQMLAQKQMLEAATWSNPGYQEFKNAVGTEPEIAADTDDLVRIFRDILERARKRPTFNLKDDTVTVDQMIQFLTRCLVMEDKPIALHKLLKNTRSERALVATFLALLELVRLQAVLLRQDRAFSDIYIKKHTAFDDVVAEGLTRAKDDWQ